MAARKRIKPIPRVEQESSVRELREPQRDLVSAFTQTLRAWNERTGTDALGGFDALVRAGCADERLAGMLVALQHAWECEQEIHADAPRINSRTLRSLVESTCSVARKWELEFHSQFGKTILERASRRDVFCKKADYLNLPQMLRSLADEAKTIYGGSSRQRRPLYDDNLAMLMEYVKLKTGHYNDAKVSALVWFATGRERDENTLRVWRNEHSDPLERARLCLATP